MKISRMIEADIDRLLPVRELDTHKGDYGKLLLLCGSRGYTGAATFATMGALRTGAGLVYLCVPESIYTIVASKLLEPVIFPMPDENGMLSASAIDAIAGLLDITDAILIGPGLGKSTGTSQVLRWILANYNRPIVVDADGINMLCEHIDVLRGRTSPTILTPHEGEFMRIGGDLQKGRIQSAVDMAYQFNAIIVLKGYETVITDGVNIYLNPTGNPGMAVGGSGDVLAGIIVSMLGQKIPALEAAACGAWLHGKAGDICAEQIGQYGMLPSDLLEVLPRLLK